MIVRKLRLQKGWSQQHLSKVSGISVRTIQRIEQGQNAGLESLTSLASVFEIELSQLQSQIAGVKDKPTDLESTNMMQSNENSISLEEEQAIKEVREIKGFYSNLATYVAVITTMLIINLITSPEYLWVIWPALGWGIGIAFHGLSVFEVVTLFSPSWEKKQIEKRLKRKL